MDRKDIIIILENVRERLKHSDNWCKDFVAVDEDSIDVNVFDSTAVRWCLVGGLMREGAISDMYPIKLQPELVGEVKKSIVALHSGFDMEEFGMIPRFNDCADHPMILEVLDHALGRLREEIRNEID